MVDLSEFKTDTRAINDGTWIRVNEGMYGNLEILSRGFTDAFMDANNMRMSKAAREYGGDRTMIPQAELRTINASLLEDYLVIDVRNLNDGQNGPVKVQDFHLMLYDHAFNTLARACWEAAGRISVRSVKQIETIKGNLLPPSESGSNGAASETN